MSTLLITVLNPTLPSPLDWLPIICRIVAISLLAPFLFITFLEVAAYLIVRTLGFSSLPMTRAGVYEDPNEVVPLSKSEVNSADSSPSIAAVLLPSDSTSSFPAAMPAPHIRVPPSAIVLPTPSPKIERLSAYFATPGEHDFRLSGTGLFSPPDSRPGSPNQNKAPCDRDALSDATSSSGDEESPSTGSPGIIITIPAAARTTDGSEIRSRHSGMRRGLAAMTPIEAR